MSIRKSIAAIALVVVAVLAGAAKCGPGSDKSNCAATPLPVPQAAAQDPDVECSFAPPPPSSPAITTYGDGIYEVGKDMPAGTWESAGIPADTPKCVWFVSPNPSKDANTQNTPSYTQFKDQHHRIQIVLESGMGFTTIKCGLWELSAGTSSTPDAR